MSSLITRLSKRHLITAVTTTYCPKKLNLLRADPNITIIEHDLNPENYDINGFFDFLWQFGQIFIDENDDILNTALRYLGSGDFDVMVGDAAVDGNLVAAEVHDTPTIAIVSGYQGPTENIQDSTDYLSWKVFLLLFHHASRPYYDWREKQREMFKLPELGLKKVDFCEYAGLFPMIINASPAFYPPVHPSLEHLYTGAHRNVEILDKVEGELKDWIDSDDRSIVFISMGTSGFFEASVVEKFVENVEKQDQVRFIWAHGHKLGQVFEETGVKTNEKLFVGKYLPQVDLFLHDKVRAFMSHGGLHSSLDAARTTIPVICVPQYADQMYNCQKLADLGMAVYVESFDYIKILSANQIIDSDYSKFVANAENLRRNFAEYENDEDLFKFVEKIAARKSVSRLTEYPFQYHARWFLPVYYTVYYGLWLVAGLLVVSLCVLARAVVRKLSYKTAKKEKKLN